MFVFSEAACCWHYIIGISKAILLNSTIRCMALSCPNSLAHQTYCFSYKTNLSWRTAVYTTTVLSCMTALSSSKIAPSRLTALSCKTVLTWKSYISSITALFPCYLHQFELLDRRNNHQTQLIINSQFPTSVRKNQEYQNGSGYLILPPSISSLAHTLGK